MGVILGFDPGGVGNFGWCVSYDADTLPLAVIATGLADGGSVAVEAALNAIPQGHNVVAAGIDAPLVWSKQGARKADVLLRSAIRNAGAPHPSGTVQDVNSLRGACLVQGLLTGMLLRERFPSIVISEAHPKALRWLLTEATDIDAQTEHQRDAILGAFSAWAAIHQPNGWVDLFSEAGSIYSPLGGQLVYFMPLYLSNQRLPPWAVRAVSGSG